MRFCPTCRTQYTDDTLRFCLQDGASLIERTESDTPTVAFPETETVVARRQETSNVVDPARSERKGNGVAIAIGAVAGVLILLGLVSLVGVWIFTGQNSGIANANNGNSPANNANINLPSATKTPTPTGNPTLTPTPSPSPEIERPTQTVAQVVDGWKSSAEARDLDSYMSNYADSVDYYNKSGASRDAVRRDKTRAFTMYDEMNINIQNLSFEVSADGRTATAVFDKAWEFLGERTSTGKVQTRLQFRNSGGRWLIISERDLKVYSTK